MADQQNGGNAFVKAFIPGLIIGFVVGAAVGVVISATGGDVGALTQSNEPTVTTTTPSGDREFGDRDGMRETVNDTLDEAGEAIEDGAEAVQQGIEDGVDAVRDAVEDATTPGAGSDSGGG